MNMSRAGQQDTPKYYQYQGNSVGDLAFPTVKLISAPTDSGELTLTLTL
jgi:hypothetical protein